MLSVTPTNTMKSLTLFLCVASSTLGVGAVPRAGNGLNLDVDVPPRYGYGETQGQSQRQSVLPDLLVPPHREPKCPPCFNCLLPAFTCGQFAECNKYDGQCKCPPGWAGIDCLTPQCDSLKDGEHRRPREGDKPCECKEGWGGVNCNVCKTSSACTNFPLPEWAQPSNRLVNGHQLPNLQDGEGGQGEVNMTCYKGGETVINNHQMCDVTNRKILDMLPGRPPQVTFSCSNPSIPAAFLPPGSPGSPSPSSSSSPSLFSSLTKGKTPSSPPSNGNETQSKASCAFQFYTAQIESFYCALEDCVSSRKVGYAKNETRYECEKIRCQCVPGRFICGEDGSVDIGDFLTEEIKGPASFSCSSTLVDSSPDQEPQTASSCKFEEPAMNDLIDQMFGDRYITLECEGGECLREDMVPGYVRPPKPDNTMWVALSVASLLAVVLFAVLILWYASTSPSSPTLRLPPDEAYKLMTEHIPASLHFTDITYTLSPSSSGSSSANGNGRPSRGRTVLKNISGSIKAGEMMAIMGASGAGKSTLLDILAGRGKQGSVSGGIWVNGREVRMDGSVGAGAADESDANPNATTNGNGAVDRGYVTPSQYKKIIGYVDQEDTLMPTLTVYETVLYSALLRLPRSMSYQSKALRVDQTLSSLGLLPLSNTLIGKPGTRSLSGGEKRRVSIACELVTSPSILFLDEPTSGLDAYNAKNVVDALRVLCKEWGRTVVMTIHQPRSGVVGMFDRMVVLGRGRTVFSGVWSGGEGERYLEGVGRGCPSGYNVADYLIDLTMQDTADERERENTARNALPASSSTSTTLSDTTNLNDPERGLQAHSLIPHNVPISIRSVVSGNYDSRIATPTTPIAEEVGESTEMQPTSRTTQRSTGAGGGAGGYIRRKTSRIFEVLSGGSSSRNSVDGDDEDDDIPPTLAELLEAYEKSDVARQIREEGEQLRFSSTNTSTELPNAPFEHILLRGRKRASHATQFRILSGRAFKNLYRDPALLTAHYVGAVGLAGVCGMFYYGVSNDISGFQNRLGIFFFTLALFGFSCLSSLGLFANERILFMRERANGYYSTFTYFSSKILFDILPLRLVPPLMFGGIVYGLVGLVPTVAGFWKFMLTLVLFNLTTASVVLWLSIAFANTSVASLVGTLIMLFNLLFTGLLINRESVTPAFRWLHTLSFFHAAFEALAVNELRYLQLKEVRYGVELDVPAATILSVFGLRAQSFWWPNISLLVIFFLTFTTASFLTLHFFVKEKR